MQLFSAARTTQPAVYGSAGRSRRPWRSTRKHDVYVVSDEIWSDLLLNGHKHITTQSVSEDAKQRTVALYAPSKTFNLAGLIGSYHIIYNDWLRDRILKESSLSHYNSMNLLSMYALLVPISWKVMNGWMN